MTDRPEYWESDENWAVYEAAIETKAKDTLQEIAINQIRLRRELALQLARESYRKSNYLKVNWMHEGF